MRATTSSSSSGSAAAAGGGSRRRERVLLGLDQAFASSSTASSAPATASTGGPAQRRPGTSTAPSSRLPTDDASLYAELPAHLGTTTLGDEGEQQQGHTPATVESALQELLLRNMNATDVLARGKTIMLNNTRGQTEQQRQETRVRRHLLRGRNRLFRVRVPEEGNGQKSASRPVAQPRSHAGLEAGWQAYMQELLGVPDDSSQPDSAKAVKGSKSANKRGSLEKAATTADLRGCRLRVVASRCPSELGLEGVVLRESRGAFHLLPGGSNTTEPPRRLKIVPKAGRVFHAHVAAGLHLALHGNGLVDRSRAIASPLLLAPTKGRGGGEQGRRLLTTTALM